MVQEKDIGLATAHKAVREKFNLFPYSNKVCIDARGHHIHHLLFLSAQRISERTVEVLSVSKETYQWVPFAAV
jgi:hypothetical protein